MQKTILLTGATDGIGLETAKMLVADGHHVLLHGRNPSKLEAAEKALADLPGEGQTESYTADLSHLPDVEALATKVANKHPTLDAGIFTPGSQTPDGDDIRFMVNTIAPCLLTKRLLPKLGKAGRVINLSYAARFFLNSSPIFVCSNHSLRPFRCGGDKNGRV